MSPCLTLQDSHFTERADRAEEPADRFGLFGEGWFVTGAIVDALAGNDRIDGSNVFGDGVTILNGTLKTGAEDGVGNALTGGFTSSGSGTVRLGDGSDTLKGFGRVRAFGGDGLNRILFSEGRYEIWAALNASTITRDFLTMNVSEFDTIGGVGGGRFDFRNGTLTVGADGVASFV